MSSQATGQKPVAALLATLLERKGLRPEDVASKLFISHRTVARWLAGSHEPTPTLGRALGELFGIDWREFYTEPSEEAA